MKRILFALGSLALAAAAFSCGNPSSPDAVAQHGNAVLTVQELRDNLPPDLTPADSERLARLYIDQWLRDAILAQAAMDSVPDAEQRIDARVQQYRRRLLRMELQDYWARNQLDSAVADTQLQAYYTAHADQFVARRPYYRFFYLYIPKGLATPLFMRRLTLLKPEELAGLRTEMQAVAGAKVKLDSLWSDGAELQLMEAPSGLLDTYLKNPPRDRVLAVVPPEADAEFAHVFMMLGAVQPGQPLPLALARDAARSALLARRRNQLVEQSESRLLKQAQHHE